MASEKLLMTDTKKTSCWKSTRVRVIAAVAGFMLAGVGVAAGFGVAYEKDCQAAQAVCTLMKNGEYEEADALYHNTVEGDERREQMVKEDVTALSKEILMQFIGAEIYFDETDEALRTLKDMGVKRAAEDLDLAQKMGLPSWDGRITYQEMIAICTEVADDDPYYEAYQTRLALILEDYEEYTRAMMEYRMEDGNYTAALEEITMTAQAFPQGADRTAVYALEKEVFATCADQAIALCKTGDYKRALNTIESFGAYYGKDGYEEYTAAYDACVQMVMDGQEYGRAADSLERMMSFTAEKNRAALETQYAEVMGKGIEEQYAQMQELIEEGNAYHLTSQGIYYAEYMTDEDKAAVTALYKQAAQEMAQYDEYTAASMCLDAVIRAFPEQAQAEGFTALKEEYQRREAVLEEQALAAAWADKNYPEVRWRLAADASTEAKRQDRYATAVSCAQDCLDGGSFELAREFLEIASEYADVTKETNTVEALYTACDEAQEAWESGEDERQAQNALATASYRETIASLSGESNSYSVRFEDFDGNGVDELIYIGNIAAMPEEDSDSYWERKSPHYSWCTVYTLRDGKPVCILEPQVVHFYVSGSCGNVYVLEDNGTRYLAVCASVGGTGDVIRHHRGYTKVFTMQNGAFALAESGEYDGLVGDNGYIDGSGTMTVNGQAATRVTYERLIDGKTMVQLCGTTDWEYADGRWYPKGI